MAILSEDELKLLNNILSQLNFKLEDARKVLSIVDKLKTGVSFPDLKSETANPIQEEVTIPQEV